MEEINKNEETFRQIDAQIPEHMELKNPVLAMEKELNDTKAYLNVVLQELENTKVANIPVEKKTRKKNVWKRIALLETVLVISGCAIFIIYSNHQQSLPTMNAQENIPVEQEEINTVLPVVETTRLCNDLNSIMLNSAYDCGEFKPSIVTLFGYEYLMFSNGEVQVYYRNEFPADAMNHRQKIMIDNGKRISEFVWEYDFNKGLESLCPKLGSFSENEEKQLIFTLFDEHYSSVIPKELRAVSTTNLWEHEPMDLEATLNSIFELTYTEVGNDSNHPDMRMNVSTGKASYTYAIDKDEYVNAMYYDEKLIQFEKHFTMEIDENAITFQAIPYLTEQKYLGEYTATIGLSNNTLKITNASYSAYVNANQEDAENDGVITPRSNILTDNRIKLYGRQGESFLIELSNVAERSTVLQEDIVKDENGFKTYSDGEVTSIPGIDVSKFQGDIDWAKVKASGVEYAIIRVGFRGYNEGTLEIDPCFEANIKGATENGIHVGVYFFSQAINEEEAKEEANFVLEQIKGYNVTYPVIIDTEYVTTYAARANKLSRQLRTDIVKTFCEEMKVNGYKPMVYSNTKYMVMGIDVEQLQDYDFWFAYYGDELNFPYHFDMLQYSEKGKVDGIKANVDLNMSFKDYSKMQ